MSKIDKKDVLETTDESPKKVTRVSKSNTKTARGSSGTKKTTSTSRPKKTGPKTESTSAKSQKAGTRKKSTTTSKNDTVQKTTRKTSSTRKKKDTAEEIVLNDEKSENIIPSDEIKENIINTPTDESSILISDEPNEKTELIIEPSNVNDINTVESDVKPEDTTDAEKLTLEERINRIINDESHQQLEDTNSEKEKVDDSSPILDSAPDKRKEEIELIHVSKNEPITPKRHALEETIVLKKITSDIPSNKPVKTSKRKKFIASIIIIIICIGLIIGGVGLGILSQILLTTPELNLNDFTGAESSKVYDSNGEVITELGAYLRENVTYDDLPEAVIDSFIAIEDSRFFTHPGFDLPRFSKAFLENIKSGSFSQGGSTFTMQLVKNTYFSIDDIKNSVVAEKSIDRKVQEIYLALKIEKSFNKQEIFEKYLNKLNFGGNIRGIQKASLYYFGKDITDVSLSEAALLAGIINLPNRYNPYYYLDYATTRRNTVLDMMYRHGYITQDEADLAKAIKVEDLLVGEQSTYNRKDSQYQSYIDAVIQEAQQITGKDPALSSMTIYTYMDRDVQDLIDSIQNGTSKIKFPDDLMQTAIVSMNNQTGAVLGVGGGRNYDGARLLNRATSGFKQPGSAVKPFLSYALAFENLYWSNKHVLTDRPYTYRGSTLVLKNFDGKYRGDVIIDQAMAESLNIPAIDTLQQVIDEIGKEAIVKYMQTIGFSKITNENFDISYAIGGSSFETTVFEMAGAHAMLINKGVYNKPHTIQKIVMQDGTVYYPQDQNIKVLSSGSAYLVAELMLYAVNGPYYNYMQILKRDYPVYAKTGTSDWGKDGAPYNIPKGAAKDKWMISSSTQFTNAVWVGYDKGIKDKGTYFNSYKSSLNLTGNISKLLMDAVEKTTSVVPSAIEKPNDIEEITYVLGSWPYAKVEDWTQGMAVTAEIRKGHPPLAPLSDSATADSLVLSGMSIHRLEDGSIAVNWHASGRCSNGVKDLTLNDGKNLIPATGTCLFDPSIAAGYPSYFATVYIDDVPLYNISSTDGYYQGWPGDLYGTVKVCGGFSTSKGTSNTACATLTY